MRRIQALCLLAALAALHAPAVLAAVRPAPSEARHHHPGCPWKAREEPCPHRGPAPAPGETAWSPCPAPTPSVVLAAGPDIAPRSDGARPRSTSRPATRAIPDRDPSVRNDAPPPDPRPPRALPAR